MRSDNPLYSFISLAVMAAMLISIINPAVARSTTICDYDSYNPSLEHAVKAFMDPAQFDCAELEIRAVMDATDPSDKEAVARVNFLLAGALFGRQLSSDISDSIIIEYLIRGFLAVPDLAEDWYFADMSEFMRLVPIARGKAEGLAKCPLGEDGPSLQHAREAMSRYQLYQCGAQEVSAVIENLREAAPPDSIALAEASMLLGQAYFGINLAGDAEIADSIIVQQLADGFVYNPKHREAWLFFGNDDFMNLLPPARELAEARKKDGKKSIFKSVWFLAGVGASVAGVLVAVLSGGGDDPSPPDTIPSFPTPPDE